MDNKIEIKHPVEIKDGSKERVAFDLMDKIASYESSKTENKNDRKYWLTLYRQCLNAVYDSQAEPNQQEE